MAKVKNIFPNLTSEFVGSVMTSNGGYSVLAEPGKVEVQTRDVMNGSWHRWHPKLTPDEARKLVLVLEQAIWKAGG